MRVQARGGPLSKPSRGHHERWDRGVLPQNPNSRQMSPGGGTAAEERGAPVGTEQAGGERRGAPQAKHLAAQEALPQRLRLCSSCASSAPLTCTARRAFSPAPCTCTTPTTLACCDCRTASRVDDLATRPQVFDTRNVARRPVTVRRGTLLNCRLLVLP